MRKLVVSVFLIMVFSICGANAEEKHFGPFVIDTSALSVIVLNGELDAGSALNFRRALDEAPDAQVLALNSPGGIVQMGLLIADDVHERSLDTYVPENAGCYSACSIIFLAGAGRLAEGELGVHQLTSSTGDLTSAQLTISDIIEVLNRFGTPTEVLTAMFRTPNSDMYVFSDDEIEKFGINRDRATGNDLAQPRPERKSDDTDAALPRDLSALEKRRELSALDHPTTQPKQLALYAGLDFYGRDIGAFRAKDAVECAARCLQQPNACAAFTFNTNPRITQGPNCFLKADRGQPDGNIDAFSGLFLSRAQSGAQTFNVGVIDPNHGVFEGVDLPGGDIFRSPAAGISTAPDCRLACVANSSCLAFTFVERKRHCWLKGRVPKARYADGMISGVKRSEWFAPVDVISLE
jgi:hypothetical protein